MMTTSVVDIQALLQKLVFLLVPGNTRNLSVVGFSQAPQRHALPIISSVFIEWMIGATIFALQRNSASLPAGHNRASAVDGA